MSSDTLSLILSASIGVVFITAMTISMCKPDRLRCRELAVWLWAALAGHKARARLRFILASRERAAREALAEQIRSDVESGKRAAEMDPGAFGTLLQLRRERRAEAYAQAGAAQAAGLAAELELKPPCTCKKRGCARFHGVLRLRRF